AYLSTYRATRGLVGEVGRVEMPPEVRARLRQFLLDQLGARQPGGCAPPYGSSCSTSSAPDNRRSGSPVSQRALLANEHRVIGRVTRRGPGVGSSDPFLPA